MKISFVVEAMKGILINKFYLIVNQFYNDYDFSLYEFGLVRENVLKNLLIIKDVLIKPIKSIQKPNKIMINKFPRINTYNKEKIIDFIKYYSRNKIFRFFNNASIIKI